MTFTQAIKNMFGFVITQPIHLSLRQMRLVPIAMLSNAVAMLWYILINIRSIEDPMQVAIAYGTIAVALIPIISKGIDALSKSTEQDHKESN